MEAISTEKEMRDKFMDAFRFDENDLVANREGQLSLRQKQQMRRYAIFSIVFFGLVVPFALFLLIVYLEENSRWETATYVLFGFLSLMPVLTGLGLFWQYWQTYKSGTVVCLNGTVDFRYEKGKLLMEIDEESIGVSAHVRGLFQKDVIYNVYYIDFVNHIMSVERVQSKQSAA